MSIKSFIFILPTLLVLTEGKVAGFFVFNGIQLSSAYFNSQEILIYITTNLNDMSLCNWQGLLSVFNPRRSAFLLSVLARGEEKEKKTDHKSPLILALTFSLNLLFHYSSKNYKLLYQWQLPRISAAVHFRDVLRTKMTGH